MSSSSSNAAQASSLSKISRDNEALIRDLQAEFKEMMMLSTLADKRRQTEDVARAAGQAGSPAAPPYAAGGFIAAVSPPVAGGSAGSYAAFNNVGAYSTSPLRRLSMNFAASGGVGASAQQQPAASITSPTTSAALRRASVNAIFDGSSNSSNPMASSNTSNRYAPLISAIPEVRERSDGGSSARDDVDDDDGSASESASVGGGSATFSHSSAAAAAAAPHLTRLNLASSSAAAGSGGVASLAPGISLPHKLVRPSLTSRVSEALAGQAAMSPAAAAPPRREAPRAPLVAHVDDGDSSSRPSVSGSASAVRQTGRLQRNSPPPFGGGTVNTNSNNNSNSSSASSAPIGGPAVHSKGSAAYSLAAQAAAGAQAAQLRADTMRTIIAGEAAGIPATSTLAVMSSSSSLSDNNGGNGSVAGASAVADWAAQVQARKEAAAAAELQREETLRRQKVELGPERMLLLALTNLPSYRSQSTLGGPIGSNALSGGSSSSSRLSPSSSPQGQGTRNLAEAVVAGALQVMAGGDNPLAQQLALTSRSTASTGSSLSANTATSHRPARAAPTAPGASAGTAASSPPASPRLQASKGPQVGSNVDAIAAAATTNASAIARARKLMASSSLSSTSSSLSSSLLAQQITAAAASNAGLSNTAQFAPVAAPATLPQAQAQSQPALAVAQDSILPEWLVGQPMMPVVVAPAPKQTAAPAPRLTAKPPAAPQAAAPAQPQAMQQAVKPPLPSNVLMMANTAVPSTRPRLAMVSQHEYAAVMAAQSQQNAKNAGRQALADQYSGTGALQITAPPSQATAQQQNQQPQQNSQEEAVPGTPRQLKVFLESSGTEEVVSVNQTLVIVKQQLQKERGVPASVILQAPDVSVAATTTVAASAAAQQQKAQRPVEQPQAQQQQQPAQIVSKPIPAMYAMQAEKKGHSIAGTVSVRRPSLDYSQQLLNFVVEHHEQLTGAPVNAGDAAQDPYWPPFKPFSQHDEEAAENYAHTGSPEGLDAAGAAGGHKGGKTQSRTAGDLLVNAGVVKDPNSRASQRRSIAASGGQQQQPSDVLLSRIHGAADNVVSRAYITTARRNSNAGSVTSVGSATDPDRIRQHFANRRRGSTASGASFDYNGNNANAAIGVDSVTGGDDGDNNGQAAAQSAGTYEDPEAAALLQRAKGLTAAANAMVGAAKSLSSVAAKGDALLRGEPLPASAAPSQQQQQQQQFSSAPAKRGGESILSPRSMNVLQAAADAVGDSTPFAADDPSVLAEQVKQLESRLGVLRNTLREKDREAADAAVRAAGGLQRPRRRNSTGMSNGGNAAGRRASYDSAGYNVEGYADEYYDTADDDNESFSGAEPNKGDYVDGDPRFPLPSFGANNNNNRVGGGGGGGWRPPRSPSQYDTGLYAPMPPQQQYYQQPPPPPPMPMVNQHQYHYGAGSSVDGSINTDGYGRGGQQQQQILKQKDEDAVGSLLPAVDSFNGMDPGTELADADDPPDVVLKGRLGKPGSLGTFWNVRYCVLTTDHLIYYASKEDAQKEMRLHKAKLRNSPQGGIGLGATSVTRKGAVDLSSVSIAMGSGPVTGSPTKFTFQLIGPKRVFIFAAATEASLLNWVGALTTVLGVELTDVLAAAGPEYADVGALTVGGQGALPSSSSTSSRPGRGVRPPQLRSASRGAGGKAVTFAYGLPSHADDGQDGDYQDGEEDGYGDDGGDYYAPYPQQQQAQHHSRRGPKNYSTSFYAT